MDVKLQACLYNENWTKVELISDSIDACPEINDIDGQKDSLK
jgi:hypothetical protein